MLNTPLNIKQERILRERFTQLQANEAAISFCQLQGLLFAIACSPEPIKPAEWFELLWLNDEPQFDEAKEARLFFKQVVALSDHIAGLTEQGQFLPFSHQYSERLQSELTQWCEGLLMGHNYLEDLWLLALDDLDDQNLWNEVDASLSLATTFADLVEARQLSLEEGMELTDEHLPEAYEVFGRVLGTYASVGSLWAEGVWASDAEQLFLALEPVPAEQLCPCGSGLIFAKCCLH